MPASKISSLTALTSADNSDVLPIVDVSDSTQALTGTTKKITYGNLNPDASDTVKGKVELATTAETTTGTDATRAVTPDGLHDMTSLSGAAWFLDEDNMSSNSDTKTVSQQSVKAYIDSGTVTMTNKTLTSPVITGFSGWQGISATLTYSSADDPTYVVSTSSDLTGFLGVGMKMKFSNNSTTFFGFITAITSGSITLYGGTDYDVANSAITNVFYSTERVPYGFTIDPTKWTVLVTDGTDRSVSGTGGTWNNVGGSNAQITVPIGVWYVSYQLDGYADRTAAGTAQAILATLSTANNTESDNLWTSSVDSYGSSVGSSSEMAGGHTSKSRTVTQSSKQLYYLNMVSDSSGSWTYQNSTAGAMILQAICAYL